MNQNNIKTCWICGAPADSREHIFKKSDFVRRYGNRPFKEIGGMLHFKKGIGRNVPSPSSKIVSYDPLICTDCNNNKSQPWDKAYEIFEKWIFENSSQIFEKRRIPLWEVYDHETYTYQCPNLYKYFVKTFGCRLASIDVPVPVNLTNLLSQEHFETGLRLSFSINKSTFAMLPKDRDNIQGVGELHRIDSESQGYMERYSWSYDIGWLTIWYFYDLEVPCELVAIWTSDTACIYLGEYESASLDELMEAAKAENTPILSRLELIKKNGGIKIE